MHINIKESKKCIKKSMNWFILETSHRKKNNIREHAKKYKRTRPQGWGGGWVEPHMIYEGGGLSG